jgi:nucleotide-binding universal stress UspA family protein
MFEKILIATDLSPASDCLVQCAADLKTIGMKQAVLAHVVYVANTPGLEDMLMEKAKPRLEHQKSLLVEQGIKVATVQELGIPADDLSDLAEWHDVAAILISSRGLGLALCPGRRLLQTAADYQTPCLSFPHEYTRRGGSVPPFGLSAAIREHPFPH